jgi:hypothetical protein
MLFSPAALRLFDARYWLTFAVSCKRIKESERSEQSLNRLSLQRFVRPKPTH